MRKEVRPLTHFLYGKSAVSFGACFGLGCCQGGHYAQGGARLSIQGGCPSMLLGRWRESS